MLSTVEAGPGVEMAPPSGDVDGGTVHTMYSAGGEDGLGPCPFGASILVGETMYPLTHKCERVYSPHLCSGKWVGMMEGWVV